MGTSYPGALDTFTNPAPTDGMNLPAHSAQHANANDAIAAIQAALGVNPQGGYDDVAARLDDLAGGGGGPAGLVKVAAGAFATSAGVLLPNGCFDSTYDDYHLSLTLTASSAAGLVGLQLCDSSGTPNTSSIASGLMVESNASGGGTAAGTRVTSTTLLVVGYRHGTAGKSTAALDIFGPALAEATLTAGRYNSTTSGGGNGGGTSGWHEVATAFPRALILPASGTITGRWTLFGYAK